MSGRDMGRIHSASLEILRETGMAFGSEKAVGVFKSHGLKTSGETVYFTDKIIETALEMAPAEFTLLARDPARNLDFSPRVRAIGPGSGAVCVVDGEGRTRQPTGQDFIRAARLVQVLPQIGFCRPLFLPYDVPPAQVHTWMMAQQILNQDKPYFLMTGRDVPLLSRAFGRDASGMRDSALTGRAYGLSSINIISPLFIPREACDNLLAYCRSGVTFHITSMPAAGSTAPCSLTAAVVMQNCENLGALVLSQLVSPGHPVFYGAMGGHSEMRMMHSVFGGPENRLVELAGARMADYYGLLSRGDVSITDAPVCDFQAGAESMYQFFSAVAGGVNLLPGCGLLGSFMGASLEKLILDVECLDYVIKALAPLKFGEDDLAVDIIKSVGPKGNFINHPHTFKRFRTEFHHPQVFRRQSYARWHKAGRPGLDILAENAVETFLQKYRPPDIEAGLRRELLNLCDLKTKNIRPFGEEKK